MKPNRSSWPFITMVVVVLIVVFTSSVLQASTMQIYDSTLMAISFMISVLIMKVTAFILGYLIVKLGHDTFIKGVTGEIDFGFSGSGFSTKLKSGSPGAFFVLAGAAIIMWALFVDKPFETGHESTPVAIEQPANSEEVEIKKIPDEERPKLKR